MKRSASRDLQKKEKTKKVDHANDAIPIVVAQGGELRDLVAGWVGECGFEGDTAETMVSKWLHAFRLQGVGNHDALQELSSNEAGWNAMLLDFNVNAKTRMLATKLKIWKAQQGMFRFALLDFPTCFLTCPFLQNSDTHT